jgi:tight adherence protein B
MGIFLGLVFGLGLFLILMSGQPRRSGSGAPDRWRAATREALSQAGMTGLNPDQLLVISVGAGLLAGLVVLIISSTWSLAGAFFLFATALPRTMVERRRRTRVRELRELWPDVVDNLASAVRAGMALPEGLASIGVRGPAPLRPAFVRFGEDYRATGSFSDSLDRLAATLADPVADRIIESLRMAREVGGTDLGRLLRTLSAFLREDARTRAELETRQGWTINAARLALAAPWAVLLLLSTRGSTVRAYDSPTGVLVLAAGGGLSLVAYVLMRRIGRLPREGRVLRSPGPAAPVGTPGGPGAGRSGPAGPVNPTPAARR